MLEAISKDGRLGVFHRLNRTDLLRRGAVLTTKPPRTCTLVVRDTGGKPVVGAAASLNAMYDPGSSVGKPLPTDSNGEALIEVFEGGLYYPQVVLDGYYYDNCIRLLPPVGSKDWKGTAEVVMEPATRLQKGRVVDRAGNPVEGVEVEPEPHIEKLTLTDPNGEFTLTNLPDSKIRLYARRPPLFGSVVVSKDTDYATIQVRDTSQPAGHAE